ncbi:LapA family protein [Geoalkalibacter subterraneus]|uniref:LapA family protein n=1 Tax=Geoalkalibacter subterraneus TaxID=483547 RepID=UPI000693CC61|nr:LapA family protein [Geoalkalibacter subterraneus]
MARAKLITALVLVIVGLIVVLQNTQLVEIKFLLMAATMPLAALLALTMIIGIAVGMLIALGLSARKPRKTEKAHRAGH